MKSILFICTGNIFRSVVAEYALKALLGPASGYVVGSTGTEAPPQQVPPLIRDCLLKKEADLSRHVQRRLTRELLDSADLPVAMGMDHRVFIRLHFNREVLLFNEVCYQKQEPILDVHEAIPDWQGDPEAVRAYVVSVVDYLWEAMPAFVARLPRL